MRKPSNRRAPIFYSLKTEKIGFRLTDYAARWIKVDRPEKQTSSQERLYT